MNYMIQLQRIPLCIINIIMNIFITFDILLIYYLIKKIKILKYFNILKVLYIYINLSHFYNF